MAKNESRPSWETYFMNITNLVAKRSTCLRRAVGAVLVKDKRILSTGYNGSPSGLKHCIEVGCLREQLGVESGKMHELVSNIGFSGIILAPLFLSVHFRTSISWKKYWFPTLMVGVFTVILVPLYLTDFFVSWNGFVQRLLLANLLIWIEAVAFKIYRR